jgi:hypothetical protein
MGTSGYVHLIPSGHTLRVPTDQFPSVLFENLIEFD